MNHQEIFNTVSAHLLTQQAKGVDDHSLVCQYRGKNGLSCAVGCLISDEQYSKKLEGVSVYALIEYEQDLLKELSLTDIINVENENLLISLQDIHDFRNVRSWKNELHQVAINFNLDSSVLNSF